MAGSPRQNRFLISIHALREEGDQEIYAQGTAVDISIHALREEGDLLRGKSYPAWPISIHALREEGDLVIQPFGQTLEDFYPRPPRGGRPAVLHLLRSMTRFLSTPSARRATFRSLPYGSGFVNFYPRPPRGGRRDCIRTLTTPARFLSTPSARRATRTSKENIAALEKFLSTPSARRATAKTETKSLFSNKLYNILHEFRRALICNRSKNYPNHAKRLENPVRRCRKDAENSPFAPGRETQNNSRPSCSKGG